MIFILILIINVVLLFMLRSDKRYWFVTIPIWTVLLSFFIIWRIHYDKEISRLDTAYWKSADENKFKDNDNWHGYDKFWKELEDSKAVVKKHNATFLDSIFLQTILTFIAQVIGYRVTTAKKTYKWTAIIFGILFLINLCLKISMSIVPTGPLV